MELEMSSLSFYFLKMQTEQRIGLVIGEMTHKENIGVIKNKFLLSFDLERHPNGDYIEFKGYK